MDAKRGLGSRLLGGLRESLTSVSDGLWLWLLVSSI